MSENTTLSLRETLTQAMAGGEAPEPVALTPEAPAAPVEAVPPAPADGEKSPETAAKPAPARGDDGKFAKSPELGDDANQETAPAAEANPPPEEPIRVPPSLPAALKAKFKELSPEWRDAFMKRDEDVNSAKAQWDTKAARLNRLDEIIAPHKDAWAVQGLDDHQALTRLVAAEKVLRETPAQGILYLAQSYGVNLHQLVNQAPQQAQAPAVDPTLQPWFEKVQSLEAQLAQQSQSATAASEAAANQQIAKFASDPKHIYFDNVKNDIVVLLESGGASSLADAYEKAIWASAEIRPLLLQEKQAAAAKKATEADQRAKATAAAKASGSVIGAPTPGAVPANAGPKPSIREELQAALAARSL